MLGTITRLDPTCDIASMGDIFDRILGNGGLFERGAPIKEQLSVPMDIVEQDDRLIIRASVPGVAPEALDISIENNVLTISGEVKRDEEAETDKVYRREIGHGTFRRSVRLSRRLDTEKVDATFANGFVTITLPKVPEEHPKVHRVTVRTEV